MKRHLLLSSALAVALTIPAFAANVPEGTKLSDNQTYTFWLLDAMKSLDPQLIASVEDSDVARSLFEGLYNEDGDGNLVPAVATGFDLSDDKMTYTFHLRPEAKWSNGDPVTANDFAYAWKRLADPKLASEYAYYLELMQVVNASDIIAGNKPIDDLGVRAVDDHTFEVKLTAPLSYFPNMLTHTAVFPVHQATVEKFGEKWTDPGNIVGNGAYTLAEHVLGEKVVMQRNPGYWDDAHTVINTVTGLTINDNSIGMTRYLAGELDRVQIPAGQYPAMKEQYPDQAVSTPYACAYTYILNLDPTKGPEALKDVRVRDALSYAVDRDVIVNKILQGGQTPAYSWTPPSTAGFVMPDIEYSHWSQDERVQKATELLKEAGFGPDNPLKLQLNYNTDEGHKKIAVAVQQFWKKIGVDLTINNMEWKVHTDKMHSQDFEVARYAWCADYNEPSTFLNVFLSNSGNNDGKYDNPDYDRALKDAVTAADPQADYTKAEQLLAADMPIIPIYHYAKVDMIRPDIRGLPQHNVMQTWYAKDIYRVAE